MKIDKNNLYHYKQNRNGKDYRNIDIRIVCCEI